MSATEQHIKVKTNIDQTVLVRPITHDDVGRLVKIYEKMSLDSRYRRWNQTLDDVIPERIWREARQIATADPQKNLGLLALLDDRARTPIGAARLSETRPGTAEVAISIADEYQGQGIGSHLMRLLALAARDLGYRKLIASIRNDNPAIWIVFKRLPFNIIRTPGGAYSDITIYLTEPG